MSTSGDKPKPVGFATHITAGGIAGAMEAVSQNDLAFRASLTLSSFSYVVSLWTPSKFECNSPSRAARPG